MYSMMSLIERITAAQVLMVERHLTAHALQTHSGAKHEVDGVSAGARSKPRSMDSITMQ